MTDKSDKKYLFEIQLNWLADTSGILSVKEADGTIHVATSPKFGGNGKPWTPEHLFLSAISSSFMTTYIAYAKKINFEFVSFECDAIGLIRLFDGKYKFTKVDLYPKIYIANEMVREKANLALERTHKYCLVTNSINAAVFYHSEVLCKQYEEAEKVESISIK